jgi:two-component system phosphate regulon sensor histidine kinase PhoR
MLQYIIFLVIITILIFKLLNQRKLLVKLKFSLEDINLKLKEKTKTNSEEQTKLETVIKNMHEGVLVVNNKNEIILMNPSLKRTFMIDYPLEGKLLLAVIRNIDIKDLVDVTNKGEQKLFSKEISVNIPEEKIFKVNSAPIFSDNYITGAILVFHDITELRHLEKIRQDFVANVSHELRTPISSIKGYTETLLEGALEDKNNARDFINIINQDSNRLAKLIDDLLDLSKIESGNLKMVFLPIDILEVIKRAIAVVNNQAKEKSIQIILDSRENLPKVLADDTRLSQVMINLLDNAIKYTPNDRSIKISVYPKEKFVQIDVSDTGMGIPQENLPRIFERFYRIDKSRSRTLGGTGLGLSIVKHIVQGHGGEVWVKSELEQGSTFSFIIPTA